LDFRDSPDEAAFRDRLRSWLLLHAREFPSSGDDYWARQGDWHRALYQGGFFGLSWPREYGGQELPPVYDVIVDEELARAGAPPRPSLGYLVVGLSRHGSEGLRRRFLPPMINGTERWCQGFSEPGAGSDLASLTTTATREADSYVVHGHKIWTSYSDVADWCLLLARTDPDAKRHRGLSAFVISMKQPGVQQRPLRMMNGVTTEFGQVFFDGATVPADQMVGAPGEGWALAMTVVGHERWAMRPDTASSSGTWRPAPKEAHPRNSRGRLCRPRCSPITSGVDYPNNSTAFHTGPRGRSTSC
jgi:alkylation response protein AidB-like acyl-CoA dehydrogenase